MPDLKIEKEGDTYKFYSRLMKKKERKKKQPNLVTFIQTRVTFMTFLYT